MSAENFSGLMSKLVYLAVPLAAAATFNPGAAKALVTMSIYESGSDVVASYSGSVNTAGLLSPASSTGIGVIWPAGKVVSWGPSSPTAVTAYSGVTPPNTFGTSGPLFQVDTGGDILALGARISLPVGYVSGASISNSMIFSGQTLTTLGITPGTYTWTWGSGPNADSAVLTIGNAPSPGPTAAPGPLPLFGAAAAFTWSRRLRRRCGRGNIAG